MKFLETLLPPFNDEWIAQCAATIDANGGIPPHIATPVHPKETTYAFRATITDEANIRAMETLLQAHQNDLSSRFTVLRYLYAASGASAPSDRVTDNLDALMNGGWQEAQDQADQELRSAVRPILNDFVERLSPESISTPDQAMWEFKQALIRGRPERLKRLADQYRKTANQPLNEAHLMLARALWLPNSQKWAEFILALVSHGHRFPWEEFIETGHAFDTMIPLPESHEPAESTDSVAAALACLKKVPREALGGHWFILADCYAMLGEPGQCALVWEEHGTQILECIVGIDTEERPAQELLSLPGFQFRIADLWAEAGRTDREIQVLETLRRSHPRIEGVNRRLAERYLQMSPPDVEGAIQRIRDEAGCDEAFSEDPIIRLLIHETERSSDMERQLAEARPKYEKTPESLGQRKVIGNVLRLTWATINCLSSDVQEDWIAGLWWCYGDHPIAFDETERAGYAITKCSLALESHLRERIFEPLRKSTGPTEVRQLPDGDRLRDYLAGGHIELGAMLGAVGRASPTRAGVYKKLWDLLYKRSAKPKDLRNEAYQEISLIRNPSSHESRRDISGVNMEHASRCAELCYRFLSTLESPPIPPAGPARPGQPIPRR